MVPVFLLAVLVDLAPAWQARLETLLHAFLAGNAGLGLVEGAYARPEHRALLIPGAPRATDRLLVSITFQFPRGGR